MNSEIINKILTGIINKESTTDKEKNALMFACDCVWKANKNKIVNEIDFKQMLFDNMAFAYEIEVNETNDHTEFLIKTFKNKE